MKGMDMLHHVSWVIRLYVTGTVANTLMIAVADPSSQHNKALGMADPWGLFAVALMAVIVLIGFVDLFVNDLLPKHIHIAWTHRFRHLAFCGLAGCQLGLMYGSYENQGIEPVMSKYIWDALFCCIIAGYGVYQHWQKAHEATAKRQVAK